jgi:hypothetical protein
VCEQTTEKAIIRKEKHLDDDGDVDGDDEVIYKIEVPANRLVEFGLVNGIDAAGYPANENTENLEHANTEQLVTLLCTN